MRLFYAPFILMALMASSAPLNGQTTVKRVANQAPVVQRMMEKFHCSPRNFDNKYFEDIKRGFILDMDPYRTLFTAADIERLSNYREIQDELSGVKHTYIDQAAAIFKQRLQATVTYIAELEQKPFSFTAEEYLLLREDSFDFAKDDKELHDRVYKRIKYAILYRLGEDFLSDSLADRNAVLQNEPTVRRLVCKIERRRITQFLEHPLGFENAISATFYNAITLANDPHSAFMLDVPVKKRDLPPASDAYLLGIIIKENTKGEVSISKLVLGGPAWKTGELSIGDVLVKVKFEGQAPVDLEGLDAYEIAEILGNPKHRRMVLSVRTINGLIKNVPLTKRHTYVGESPESSYILNGPKKIGYIYLSSFYGDWTSSYSSGCARDIARETSKLDKENIEGLILDLRGNGGGSLGEANEIAGNFVDEGSLGFLQHKGGFLTDMKDPKTGVLYEGPMVVLVDDESASASEHLAGILQDYKRAVIVGGSTFGKASAQRYLPADTAMTKMDVFNSDYDLSTQHRVKITMAKLYRVTGKSNQLSGVQPDIVLPHAYDSSDYSEGAYPHAFIQDTLKRSGKFDPFRPIPVSTMAANSAERIKKSEGFRLVQQKKKLLDDLKKTNLKAIPLKYDAYLDFVKKYKGEIRDLNKKLGQDSVRLFNVINPGVDKASLKAEDGSAEVNDYLLRRILKDIYINEAYFIMSDYIDLRK